MNSLRRELARPATWIALLALVVALGGTAYAAATIDTADIVDGSIRSIDIGTDEVLGADIKANAVTGAEIATGAVRGVDVADGSLARADLFEGSALPRSRYITMVPADPPVQLLSGIGVKTIADCTASAANPQAYLSVEDPSGDSFPAVGLGANSESAAPFRIADPAYVSLVANASITDLAWFEARAVIDGSTYDIEGSAMSPANGPCHFSITIARLGEA